MKNGLSRSEQRTVSKTQKQPLDRKNPIQVSSEPCCGVDVLLSFLSFLLCRLSVFPASFPVEINALWYNALCLLWFTEVAIATWRAAPRTTRGGQQRYSSLAITTALTLRGSHRAITSPRYFL